MKKLFQHDKFKNCFVRATLDPHGDTNLEIHMEWDGQIFHESYGIRVSSPDTFELPAICRVIEKTFTKWAVYAKAHKDEIPISVQY